VPARLTHCMRWGHRVLDAESRYKLVDGTHRLIEATVADGQPDILLSAPVARVDQDGEGASVITWDGQTFAARAVVVVTAPLNTLRPLEFRPALSSGKQAASPAICACCSKARGACSWPAPRWRTDGAASSTERSRVG